MAHPLNVIQENTPWYSEGLRFKCTECGQCCTGAPGYTWINDEEITDLADHFGLTPREFSKKYLRYVNGSYALLEKPNSYDCIFLENKKCTVYALRPIQCRTFPWWAQNLTSREDWNEAASFCEGISHSAPLIPFDTIQEQLAQNEDDF